ncbi:hypothetical protein TrVE_jg3580 [Triparma verrucosa]|uniref:Uncharacterized protein n=2 Tax=Triparma TaxID=722752 RepID=A0A9W7A8N5_9STRA|nr:hypothetical protein TrST_g10141 [Triparma strigata]GMI03694.1 hypothetical protein TrVE_jg3580 [Triparma verrucosa]
MSDQENQAAQAEERDNDGCKGEYHAHRSFGSIGMKKSFMTYNCRSWWIGLFSAYSVGICAFAFLCISSLFALMSVNACFSILSVNSLFSILSVNSMFSLGCVSRSFTICW